MHGYKINQDGELIKFSDLDPVYIYVNPLYLDKRFLSPELLGRILQSLHGYKINQDGELITFSDLDPVYIFVNPLYLDKRLLSPEVLG